MTDDIETVRHYLVALLESGFIVPPAVVCAMNRIAADHSPADIIIPAIASEQRPIDRQWRARSDHPTTYLAKPFQADDLAKAIDRVIPGYRPPLLNHGDDRRCTVE